jgi:hypothetical protein
VRELAVAVVMAMSIAKTDPDDAELPALSRPLSALPMASPPSPWPEIAVSGSPPDRRRALTRARMESRPWRQRGVPYRRVRVVRSADQDIASEEES